MNSKNYTIEINGILPKGGGNSMRTLMSILLLCFFTSLVNAQGNHKLSRFFSEGYIEKYFHYAHENAGRFYGVDIEEVNSHRVTLKVSFEPNFLGSTYVCTVYAYLDSKGRFVHVKTHCDSPTRTIWPCFDMATADLKDKCLRNSHNRDAIRFMERYYGKSFRQFNGQEAMCTLLNIAWFNYDYSFVGIPFL